MKFKKMEIYGFKSFADKVQINFNDGVTGIVGPNGCGKSNVADSIRWVLGEQSAKALRGSNMQDVIFNGTEKRKPQSFSEVALTFDNTEKIFKIDYDEVILSRKLYRSGDSEYAINKMPVRLKDITELLRDSGLGRDSYNIIGQGRIDELLSAKPEERRAVFEDAAGISRLKNRKTESVKKLASTSENLTRINDIIHELEIQLEPLKSQATTAKRYLELKERLKLLDATNYVMQYDTSASKKAEITDRLNGAIEEIALKEDAFNKCVVDYQTTAEKLNSIDNEIDYLRDELLNLTVGLEKQAGESRLLEEKISTLNEQKNRYEKTLLEESGQLKKAEETLNRIKEVKKEKEDALNELSIKIDELLKSASSLKAEIDEYESEQSKNNTKVIESLGKLGDIKAEISALKAEKSNTEKQQEKYTSEKEELELNEQNYNSKISILKEKISIALKEKDQIHADIIKEKQENLKLVYKISALEEEIKDLIALESSSDSKMKLLKALKEDNEGYLSSIKKILEDSKTNTGLKGKFVNVVAKLLVVPEKFESAIDIALGASVQNIVTKSEEDAKYVIEYLKENNYGRATFIPMSAVKPKYIPGDIKKLIQRTKGVYGVADELVKFSPEYKTVFSSLLGGTVIVEDMDTAISLARATKFSFKIVTLEGDIVNPSGTMSGGSKKAQAVNLIGREREIYALAKDLENMKAEKLAKEEELKELKQNQTDFNEKQESYNALLKQFDENIARINEEVSKFVALLGDNNLRKAKNNENLDRLSKELKAIDEKIEIFLKYESDIDSGSTDILASSPEMILKKNKYSALSDEITGLKVKRASIEGELISLEGEELRLGDSHSQNIKDQQVIKLDYQRILTELEELSGKFSSRVDKDKYDANIASLQDVRDKLASSDEKKKELSVLLSKLSEDKVILSNEVQRANERKFKEENALLKIDTDIESMQEKIWEDYGLTYASAKELKLASVTLEQGLSESVRVKKQINALGVVNVNAIEMLTDVETRYNDLSVQRDDLVKAETDLNAIISDLTKEMETIFIKEFNKINTNFQGVFRELFGGGRAELRLQDESNPLECGIEIAAEPTGKKLQNITLLSGGERALTAIAILFAILKLKPMPFCVLDEIEAALDDANVERFAKYLKRFSNYTQFIVITHRKPTMELADSLYGVTMEERGVSKIVSVKLADAIKNTAKGN